MIMAVANRHIAWILAVAGIVIGADTAFLFYQLRASQFRSETFTFTVSFVLFQELLLFGSLVYVVLAAVCSVTPVPVRIGYVTTILFCIGSTLLTILIFNLFLLPHFVSSNTYYTLLIARTGTAILLLGLIHIVGLVHRAAHRDGEVKSRERKSKI